VRSLGEPSIKSLIGILTRFGLSFLSRRSCAVTAGYFENSLDLSGGRMAVLCCQLLSRLELLSGALSLL
jgi:hypothetical protein